MGVPFPAEQFAGAAEAGRSTTPALVAWGSYDKGKPRVRLLLQALARANVGVAEIHADTWAGIADKSVAGKGRLFLALVRLLAAYPVLLFRLARRPASEVILLPYPALFDIFVVWPLAGLRRQTIVFDAFISFHDTIVGDRRKLRPNGLAARLLWRVERAALNLADLVLVDTDRHGDHFAETFGLERSRIVTVPVGVEELFWSARSRPARGRPVPVPGRYVLFYGQLIPLHGLATILEAVAATSDEDIHWLIVGSGQESPLIEAFVGDRVRSNMTWLDWVPYEELPDLIRNAVVCLGIFGDGDKAGRVVPNKAFQVLAAGGSLITRDSPAMAPLADRFPETVRLVPPADPEALAGAVADAFRGERPPPVPVSARDELSPDRGVSILLHELRKREEGGQCTR